MTRPIQSVAVVALIAVPIACIVGCGNDSSGTDAGIVAADANLFGLTPEGPPMIRQVFAREEIEVNGSIRRQTGLAFGTHHALDEDDGVVTRAVAANQDIRVVLDERIPTYVLHEYECEDGTYDRIPAAATAAAVAACSPSIANLTECTSVCAPNGGFIDGNYDGWPDRKRLIDYNDDPNIVENAIALFCDGVAVPLNQTRSGYSAYGSQVFDTSTGYRSLGPAIVFDVSDDSGLRTGATCRPWFRSDLTDIDGNPICAPADGVVSAGCSGGDVDLVAFGSIALETTNSIPVNGAMGVATTASSYILIVFTAPIDVASLAAISLVGGGTPLVITPQLQDQYSVVIDLGQPFETTTDYVLTVGVGLSDMLGGQLASPVTLSWTTGSF